MTKRRVFDPYKKAKPGQTANFWKRMVRNYGPPTPGVTAQVKEACDRARAQQEQAQADRAIPEQQALPL